MTDIIKYYPHNEVGRTFVIGDLHGCYDQLMSLMKAFNFDEEKDIIYAPGDLGDRGSKSKECFELPRKKWLRSTAGNHEEIFMDSCDLRFPFNWDNWIVHGGRWAKNLPFDERLSYAKEIYELPIVIVVGEGERRFNVFHAEFHGSDADLDALAGNKEDKKPPVFLQWGDTLIKKKVSPDKHKGLSLSFVGHSIVQEIKQIGNHVFMDTGAFRLDRDGNTDFGLSMAEIDVSGKPRIKEVKRFIRK